MTDTEIKTKVLDLLSSQDMTQDELKKSLWLDSDRKVSFILKELISDNLVYKNGNTFSLTKPVVKDVVKRVKKKVVRTKSVEIPVLRTVFSLLAIGASALSIRFTAIYLLESLPLFWAVLLSSMMCVFALCAFSVVVLFIHRKQYALSLLIGVIWLITTLFSMSSTVVGMYNAQKDSFVIRTTASRLDTKTQNLYNEYEKQEVGIQVLITQKQLELDRYNKLISAYDTVEKRDAGKKDYNALSWSISVGNTFIVDQTAKIGVITEKRVALLSAADAIVVAPSFYDKIGELFHIPAYLVQFIMSCFAAVFIDILSPLSGSLALFLKEEDK